MVTQNLKIIMDDRKLPDIRMVSGDVGRDIFPAVYPSEDAEEALDLTVYQLRVIFIKPDNTFVIEDYLDGMIEIPEQAGAVTGRGFYQIRLSKDGEEIYSGQGNFYIDDQVLNDSMVESIAQVNGLQFPDDFLTSADLADYVKQEELDNYYTKSEIDAELNNIRNYSTSERVVGSWIDSKPLYEKTITYTATGTMSEGTYILGTIPNADRMMLENAFAYNTDDGRVYFLPYSNGQSTSSLLTDVSKNIVLRVKNDSWGAYNIFYVTVRYTKTTD